MPKQALKVTILLAGLVIAVVSVAHGESSEPPKSDDGVLEGVDIRGQSCGTVLSEEAAGAISPSAICVTVAPNDASREAGLSASEAIDQSEGLDENSGLSVDALREMCSEFKSDMSSRVGVCEDVLNG